MVPQINGVESTDAVEMCLLGRGSERLGFSRFGNILVGLLISGHVTKIVKFWGDRCKSWSLAMRGVSNCDDK